MEDDYGLLLKLANEIVYRIGCEASSEIDGDKICFFCGAWLDYDPNHNEGCTFVQLVELVSMPE